MNLSEYKDNRVNKCGIIPDTYANSTFSTHINYVLLATDILKQYVCKWKLNRIRGYVKIKLETIKL